LARLRRRVKRLERSEAIELKIPLKAKLEKRRTVCSPTPEAKKEGVTLTGV
jgi:hypothetical protein